MDLTHTITVLFPVAVGLVIGIFSANWKYVFFGCALATGGHFLINLMVTNIKVGLWWFWIVMPASLYVIYLFYASVFYAIKRWIGNRRAQR